MVGLQQQWSSHDIKEHPQEFSSAKAEMSRERRGPQETEEPGRGKGGVQAQGASELDGLLAVQGMGRKQPEQKGWGCSGSPSGGCSCLTCVLSGKV